MFDYDEFIARMKAQAETPERKHIQAFEDAIEKALGPYSCIGVGVYRQGSEFPYAVMIGGDGISFGTPELAVEYAKFWRVTKIAGN